MLAAAQGGSPPAKIPPSAVGIAIAQLVFSVFSLVFIYASLGAPWKTMTINSGAGLSLRFDIGLWISNICASYLSQSACDSGGTLILLPGVGGAIFFVGGILAFVNMIACI